MANFQIFSDGACDINRELAKKNNIKVIPFYVSLNHTDYFKEIDEISLDEFYKEMINNNVFPKTSLPSVQDYINAFTDDLEQGKDILCFTITDSLSGSYQSATTAKMMLEENYPNSKIIIINSWQATGSQLLMVLEAARMQQNGIEIEKIAEICEKMKEDGRIVFVVGGLENLRRGGRIGALAALSGSILNIKPIIILKGGKISSAGMGRGMKKAIKKLPEITKDDFITNNNNYKDYIFTIGTTNLFDELDKFKEMVIEVLPDAYFLNHFEIGATIAAHTGKDTLGLCYIKKYECYL